MAEQKENNVWPSGYSEAKTIDEFDYLMTGKNGAPLTKFNKDKYKQYLSTTGQRMKAVSSGVLPAGPADKEMYMVLESSGTWTFGGNTFVNVEYQILTLWWNKTTWSVENIHLLPQGKDGRDTTPWVAKEYGFSAIDPKESHLVFKDDVIWENKDVALATDVPGISNLWVLRSGIEQKEVLKIKSDIYAIAQNLSKANVYDASKFIVNAASARYMKTSPVPVKAGDIATVECYSQFQKGEFVSLDGSRFEFGYEAGVPQSELRKFVYTCPSDGYVAAVSYTFYAQDYYLKITTKKNPDSKLYVEPDDIDVKVMGFNTAINMFAINRFKGKKTSLVGDSLFTYQGSIPTGYETFYPQNDVQAIEDTYWFKLFKKLGAILETNASYSGSTVSRNTYGVTSLIGRLNAISTDTEVCLVPLGVNDYLRGFSLTEFKDHLATAFFHFRDKYPTTDFYYMIPFFTSTVTNGTYTFKQFVKACIDVCEENNISYVDMSKSPISAENWRSYLFDGIHYNKLGGDVLSEYAYMALMKGENFIQTSDDVNKLLKNSETKADWVYLLKGSFSTLIGGDHNITPWIFVRKDDVVEIAVYSVYQQADFEPADGTPTIQIGIGLGDGVKKVITTFKVPSDGLIRGVSKINNIGDFYLKISNGKLTKIYATPSDLEGIKSSVFDVGNSFEMSKPNSIVKIDFKTDLPLTLKPLPNSKLDGKLNGIVRFQVGNLVFEKWAILEVQGSSSAFYAKKNWTFQFFNDSARTSKFKIRIDKGVFLDEWIYKASWIDVTMVRNIVANRLWKQIEQTRGGLYKRDIDRFYESLDAAGFQQYDTGATGVVDGYSCELMINSEFYGIGTFNSGKKRENYNLDQNNPNHIQIETGTAGQMDFVNMTLAGGAYEYRSPKTITPDVESKIQEFKTLAGLAQAEFTAQLPTLMDTRNMVDYIIFLQFGFFPDNLGNNVMLTRWYNKFRLFPYDLDNAFGLHWAGISIWAANLNVFDVKDDLPNNTKNFWKKAKVALAPQLVARYQELKAQGILSADNVLKIFNELSYEFGQDRYKKEFEKWPDLPSKDLTGSKQIGSFINNRLAWLDTYFV